MPESQEPDITIHLRIDLEDARWWVRAEESGIGYSKSFGLLQLNEAMDWIGSSACFLMGAVAARKKETASE